MVQSFENLPAGNLTKEVQVSESRAQRRLEKVQNRQLYAIAAEWGTLELE